MLGLVCARLSQVDVLLFLRLLWEEQRPTRLHERYSHSRTDHRGRSKILVHFKVASVLHLALV